MIKNTKKHISFTYGIIILLLFAFYTYGIMSAFTIKTYAYEPMPNEERVSDEANLFTDEEEFLLLNRITELQDKTKMGFAIVTINYNNKSAMEYADDYFDYNNVALDENYDGALLLIDMDNGDLWISTSGNMIVYLTDDRIDYILDEIIGYAYTEDFYMCADIFIDCLEVYYDEGIPSNQYIYEEDTGRIIKHKSITVGEIIIALLLPIIPSILAINTIRKEYKMYEENKQSNSFNIGYRKYTVFKPGIDPEDICIDSRTVKTVTSSGSGGGRIRSGGGGGSRSSGRSSTHRSSSGRSHGGGGRSFR